MPFFAWAVAAVVIIALLAFALCVLLALSESLGKHVAERDSLVERLARRKVGTHIHQCAHWFSEDDSAMAAVDAIGRDMMENDYFDIARARDGWRKAAAGSAEVKS